MSSHKKSYEECLIHDDNWYTYYEMGDMYPFGEIYCLTKYDTDNRETFYQPKVDVTFNLDIYKQAVENFKNLRHTSTYSTQLFTGSELLSIQSRGYR